MGLFWVFILFVADLPHQPIYCSEDIALPHMEVTYKKHFDGIHLNMVAIFNCETGYLRVGSRTVHCGGYREWPYEGVFWNETFPYCLSKICCMVTANNCTIIYA